MKHATFFVWFTAGLALTGVVVALMPALHATMVRL